jgi:serine/threonine protein kinase
LGRGIFVSFVTLDTESIMADIEDAAVLGDLAVRLGLLTPEQLQEAWIELGTRGGDVEPLLRVLERKGYLTPWQSSKLIRGDNLGYFLGGYRILYKVASGSFGRVYRADDPQSGRVVAIKVLRRKWSDDPHSIDLFEREGKIGMGLHHPNLVEILAVNRDTSSQQYYIVMEFVEGGNLREILAIHKKLEAPKALKFLEDAAAGLAYAYSRGVTHRDMKLTNILIATQGTAKVVDFGLAGVYGKSQKLKDETHVDRTVDYAGLEKMTGVPTGDTRSDIYFMGCVLYELLSGRSPLDMTRDARSRMARERFNSVKPMSRDEVHAPASVFRLVETMMALNPQLRYQTPSQMLDAIREVRREVDRKGASAAASGPQTVFIVESDDRLQNALREKFKSLGFRVLLSADPARAVERFRQNPFDALVVDAGTTGEDSLLIFDRILNEAKRQDRVCAAILVLSEGQADWAQRVQPHPHAVVLVRPVTLKQLHRKLQELLQG